MEFVESQRSREDLLARIRTLEHQLEVERANCRQLEQDKRVLRQACVSLQQHAEEDEEHISNSLMRRIRDLEKEKAALEESGGDSKALHLQLDQLRKEKVDIENQLEQESEFVVNKMLKEKDELILKTHHLEEQLQHRSASPQIDTSLTVVRELAQDVIRLRQILISSGKADSGHVAHLLEEHQQLREENLRLQRKLHFALEKVATLEKQNLQIRAQTEMEDERQFNLRRSTEFSSQSASPAVHMLGSSPSVSMAHLAHHSSSSFSVPRTQSPGPSPHSAAFPRVPSATSPFSSASPGLPSSVGSLARTASPSVLASASLAPASPASQHRGVPSRSLGSS